MEVQARGRFVEHEDGGFALLDAEEVSQLHALVLASRKGGGGLSQLDISQAHFLKRTEFLDNLRLFMLGEEFHGLVDGHLQDVEDVLSLIFHFQGIGLETLTVTGFTFQHEVGHELHFHRHRTFALTFLASSSFGVEREIACRIAQLLGKRLVGKELADFIVGLHVGHGVASARLADRVLVHELDVLHHLDVAFQGEVLARTFAAFAIFTLQRLVEHVTHQCTLSRTADSRHDGHHVQREAHVDAFQVVLSGSLHLYIVVPRAMGRREVDGLFAQEIAHGMAIASLLKVVHVALIDDFASQASGIRADVDDVVGRTDDFLVVLYHHHRIAQLLELAKHLDEAVGVPAMKADARFVEDI